MYSIDNQMYRHLNIQQKILYTKIGAWFFPGYIIGARRYVICSGMHETDKYIKQYIVLLITLEY